MMTTKEWEALLDTRNATQWWVEQDEDEDDWAIKAAHPKWNVGALMGSAYSEGAADLMAAAPEAVAEVVRLRRELEQLRRECIDSANAAEGNARNAHNWEALQAVAYADRDTADCVTRILGGAHE